MKETNPSPERPSEFDLIRWIRSRVPACPEVPIGIGDDAAALRLPADALTVVSVLTFTRKCLKRQWPN